MFEVKKSSSHPLETKICMDSPTGKALCWPLKMKLLARDNGCESEEACPRSALRSSLDDALTDSKPGTSSFCLFQTAC